MLRVWAWGRQQRNIGGCRGAPRLFPTSSRSSCCLVVSIEAIEADGPADFDECPVALRNDARTGDQQQCRSDLTPSAATLGGNTRSGPAGSQVTFCGFDGHISHESVSAAGSAARGSRPAATFHVANFAAAAAADSDSDSDSATAATATATATGPDDA